jgi:hypothetical protein
MTNDDWSAEETDDPLYADRRNFYKVEKWSKDGQRIEELLFAGNSLEKAQRIFERFITKRPIAAAQDSLSTCCFRPDGRSTKCPTRWTFLQSLSKM